MKQGSIGAVFVLAAAIVLGLATPRPALAAEGGLDAVIVDSSELPKGWAFVRSFYSVTIAASDFYENYKYTYASNVGAQLEEKQFQSFAGPGRGTVFYMRFSNTEEAERAAAFARKLVWEGEEPTASKPERIFLVGSTLVIVSCAHQEMSTQLEALIRSKRGPTSKD